MERLVIIGLEMGQLMETMVRLTTRLILRQVIAYILTPPLRLKRLKVLLIAFSVLCKRLYKGRRRLYRPSSVTRPPSLNVASVASVS